MKVFYSKSLDSLAEKKSILLSNYFRSVSDWIEISKEESDLFYLGTTMPDGKRRKAGSLEVEDIPHRTGEEIASTAQDEMIKELSWCDLQIKLHQSKDERAIATIDDIYEYSRNCRNYVRNIDGKLTIIGDKPVRPK